MISASVLLHAIMATAWLPSHRTLAFAALPDPSDASHIADAPPTTPAEVPKQWLLSPLEQIVLEGDHIHHDHPEKPSDAWCLISPEHAHRKISHAFAADCANELDVRDRAGERCGVSGREPSLLCASDTETVWARSTDSHRHKDVAKFRESSCAELAEALRRGINLCCDGEDWEACRFASRAAVEGNADVVVWAYALKGDALRGDAPEL